MAKKSSAFSQPASPNAVNVAITNEPVWVRTTYDPLNPPLLTPEQIAELKALAEKPDSEIDFSDIPPLGDDFFNNAVPGMMYRALKRQTTLRIDADVLDWFKRQTEDGKGYQTAINAVLRDYVAAQTKKAG